MYLYTLMPFNIGIANGGPEVEMIMEDGTLGTPTQTGRFVIYSIGPHVNGARWRNSAVPWGSPIRLSPHGYVEVKINNQWQLLHNLPGWSEKYGNNPKGARAKLKKEYGILMQQLKPKYGLSDTDHWPADWEGDLPKTWVINDFGRIAVKYFRDYYGNHRLDAGGQPGSPKEEVLGDFMHTTPASEVALVLDKKIINEGIIVLSVSHGCIHMDPKFMQRWVALGVLKVGAKLEIHPYSQLKLPPYFLRPQGQLGNEIHFFPGAQGIGLYHVTVQQTGYPLH